MRDRNLPQRRWLRRTRGATEGRSSLQFGELARQVRGIDRDESEREGHRREQLLPLLGQRERQKLFDPRLERFSRRLVDDKAQPSGQRVDVANPPSRGPRVLVPRKGQEANFVSQLRGPVPSFIGR